MTKRRISSRKWAHKNYWANPDKARKYASEWIKTQYSKNPEFFQSRNKEWYALNSEKVKEASREWVKLNPERAKAIHDDWAKNNPEKVLESRREWAKNNSEKLKAKSSRRRALKANNGGSHTAEEWLSLKEYYGNKCLCCLRGEAELTAVGLIIAADHVKAIAEGGTDDISNIQPLCHGKGGCNNRKHTKSTDYREGTPCLELTTLSRS